MPKPLRRKLFIDKKVQGAILWRIAGYWFVSILFIIFPLAFLAVFRNPAVPMPVHLANTFVDNLPIIAMLAVLLPVIILDTLKITNRFVGPIYRVRRMLSEHQDGKPLKKIHFREKDYWTDLAQGLNFIIDELESANGTADPVQSDPVDAGQLSKSS